MSAQRISSKRLEELLGVLLPADWAVLGMATRLRIVSGDQLTRAVWPAATPAEARAARRAILRLVEWKLLVRLERQVGGLGRGSRSWTMSASAAAYRLLGMAGEARRPHLPRPAMWRHTLGISEVYVGLREVLREHEDLRLSWHGEPECWQRFTDARGERVVVKPDAYVSIRGDGYTDLAFVEVDTGSQSRAVIRAKILSYRKLASSGIVQKAQGGVFPIVVFATTTEPRLRVLERLIAELPERAQPMFAAVLIADAGRYLAGVEAP